MAADALTVKDAILRGYENPTFLRSLLAKPEDFAAEYHLDEATINSLRGLDAESLQATVSSLSDPALFMPGQQAARDLVFEQRGEQQYV